MRRQESFRGEIAGQSISAPKELSQASGRRQCSIASASVAGTHGMSVDVEEHFQVHAFENVVSRKAWQSIPSRVTRNTERVLALFDDHGVKATFFILGWIGSRMPGLVSSIASEGHEIASHGYDHSRIWALSPDQFRDDVAKTKSILEDIVGSPVRGYRAPSFSMRDDVGWAYDILAETGHEYSSSVYPIRHDHYGMPTAPRFPFRVQTAKLLEIPLTTASALGRNWPAAGGGYFRFLPAAYSRWAMNRVISRDRMPLAFYFHPWELDEEQPRVEGIRWPTRFRHYVNLGKFSGRLKHVLQEYRWDRMDRVFLDAATQK